jgi:hypothetical protein
VGDGSGGGRIGKNVEGLDFAAFEPGEIGSGHSYGTVRWTGLPAQPSDTVVANGGANRSEGEV